MPFLVKTGSFNDRPFLHHSIYFLPRGPPETGPHPRVPPDEVGLVSLLLQPRAGVGRGHRGLLGGGGGGGAVDVVDQFAEEVLRYSAEWTKSLGCVNVFSFRKVRYLTYLQCQTMTDACEWSFPAETLVYQSIFTPRDIIHWACVT